MSFARSLFLAGFVAGKRKADELWSLLQSSVVDSEDSLLLSPFVVLAISVSCPRPLPSLPRLGADPSFRSLAVSIYERRDFKLEVGASISCAANGTQVCLNISCCREPELTFGADPSPNRSGFANGESTSPRDVPSS